MCFLIGKPQLNMNFRSALFTKIAKNQVFFRLGKAKESKGKFECTYKFWFQVFGQ